MGHKKSYDNLSVHISHLDKKREQAVTEEEGREWARSRGLSYFETSASSGANVQEMFDFLFREVVKRSDMQ